MRENWKTAVVKAKTLPPGHIGKEIAEKLVHDEYGDCKEISHKWDKRIRKSMKKFPVMDMHEAIAYCNKICDMLGHKIVKRIVVFSPDVEEYAGAHYDSLKKEIHFKYNVWFSTLIHELTHHLDNSYGHGKSYCDMLDFLYRIVYEDVTGKKCHDDW